jgi:hypothetical protein
MYIIAEQAVVVLIGLLIAGTAFMSVAAALILMEGLSAKIQSLSASR